MNKVMVVFSLLIMFTAIGCTNNKLSPQKSGEFTEDDKTVVVEEDQIFGIGDAIELGDEKVIVHGVADYVEPFEWLAPEPGNKYVAIEVSVENIGSADINYGPEEFQLKDDKGFSFNISYWGNQKPTFDIGTLSPGQRVRGFITFQVLNDAGPLEVNFKPKWWNAGQVTVTL